MSAKSMFYRLFRIPQKPDTTTWSIEVNDEMPNIPTGDAATLPMETWDASGIIKALVEEDPNPTITMEPVRDDSVDVIIMRWLPTDEDVTGWARRNLKRLSPDTLAAGLLAYVQQHPVIA